MKKSILIADDEEAVLESLDMVLSDEGYSCTTALDGFQVLDLLGSGRFDLVILDLWMPRMNGIKVLQKIMDVQSDLPVIILSSYYDSDVISQALTCGVREYLIKPIEFEELIGVVNRLLHANGKDQEKQNSHSP